MNDSPSHVRKLKEAIAVIRPDKVQLNTVVRPPAERTARPLAAEMEKVRRAIGRTAKSWWISRTGKAPAAISLEAVSIHGPEASRDGRGHHRILGEPSDEVLKSLAASSFREKCGGVGPLGVKGSF